MIAFLLSNWKSVLASLGSSLAVAGLAWTLHSLDVARIQLANLSALEAQKTALIAQCESDKAITERTANDYHTKVTALDRQLAAIRKLRRTDCVPVQPTASATGDNAGASAGESASPHGLDAGNLIDYAGEAERYRLQLLACQGFIREVWREK